MNTHLSSARSARFAFPADLEPAISRDAAGERDPRDVGMTREGVDAIWSAVERLYRTGTQPAIALCLRRRGQIVLHRAIGDARGGGPGDSPSEPIVRATPETPFCIFSISKTVTAMLIHLLDERGLLRLDDPVAEFVPEFAQRGKQRISIRHVLTHRAGIPSVAGHGNDPELLRDWDRLVELLCEAKPAWVAGRRVGYHAITGGFILGEIIRRVTGKDVRTFLRDEISRRLGFRWFDYGVAPEDLGAVARNYFTGTSVPPGLSHLVRRALGVAFDEAARLSNDPRYLTSVVPSGNVVATAAELSAFFQLLLNGGELDGVRIFEPRTVRRALTESSYLELDLTLGLPMHYGLGMMLGSEYLSPFGPHTPEAFGHYGFINVVGWGDPDREISVALLTSGKPFLGVHLLRLWQLLREIGLRCGPVDRGA